MIMLDRVIERYDSKKEIWVKLQLQWIHGVHFCYCCQWCRVNVGSSIFGHFCIFKTKKINFKHEEGFILWYLSLLTISWIEKKSCFVQLTVFKKMGFWIKKGQIQTLSCTTLGFPLPTSVNCKYIYKDYLFFLITISVSFLQSWYVLESIITNRALFT